MDTLFLKFLNIIVTCTTVSLASFPAEVVNTEYGPVKGYLLEGDAGVQYMSYRGVQYAKQPVGDLRFKPLVAPDVWTEEYDASTEGPVCPQNSGPYGILFQPQSMDEACIHVNIHVPLKESDSSLPVIVYIHGGSLLYGSGDSDVYGPEYLMTKDVILVTFNYRLDALGFLDLNNSDVPGNAGLKDMVFLLQWVQRNIALFGGDPDNVTVGGQSAGSSASHILALSPITEGLFQRVILQSGSAFAAYLDNDQATGVANTKALAELLGIDTTSDATILAGLKAAAWTDILNATAQMSSQFGSVIETVFDGIEAVITEDPKIFAASGKARQVPQIVGVTDSEGGAYLETIKSLGVVAALAANIILLTPSDIRSTANATLLAEIASEINVKYFGNISAIDADTAAYDYAKLLGERDEIFTALKHAELNTEFSLGSTYLYEFTYNGDNNLVKKYVSGSEFPGAVHVDDLSYIFRMNSVTELQNFVSGSTDEAVKNRMLELWTNFIKEGNPTPSTSETVTVTWPTTDCSLTYLNIGADLTVGTYPLQEVKTFFDGLYDYEESGWTRVEKLAVAKNSACN